MKSDDIRELKAIYEASGRKDAGAWDRDVGFLLRKVDALLALDDSGEGCPFQECRYPHIPGCIECVDEWSDDVAGDEWTEGPTPMTDDAKKALDTIRKAKDAVFESTAIHESDGGRGNE